MKQQDKKKKRLRRKVTKKLVSESDFNGIAELGWSEPERQIFVQLKANNNQPIPTRDILYQTVEKMNNRLRSVKSNLMIRKTVRNVRGSEWCIGFIKLFHTTKLSGKYLDTKMSPDPINQVGYCGIYCPTCRKMKVSEAAAKLITVLESAESKGATYIKEYGEGFMGILGNLKELHCAIFCRVREDSQCDIAKCCIEKKFAGCWECKDFRTCPLLTEQFIEYCDIILRFGVKYFTQQAGQN